MTKNCFNDTGSGLRFLSENWEVSSDGDRGWVSLKVAKSEFLDSNRQRGSFAFLKKDRWFVRFPDRGIISHDDWVGRTGWAADGINMVKLSPDWHQSLLQLYLGANEKEEQKAVMFLSKDVPFVRAGGNELNRPWMRTIVNRDSAASVRARVAVAVHKDGCALVIKAEQEAQEIEVGSVRDDSGAQHLAVIFPVKGFAPNTYTIAIDPVCRDEHFVLAPRFDVRSSDDPKPPYEAATLGVGNPLYTPYTKVDFGMVFGWLGDSAFKGKAELNIEHALGVHSDVQSVDYRSFSKTSEGLFRVMFTPRFQTPGVY